MLTVYSRSFWSFSSGFVVHIYFSCLFIQFLCKQYGKMFIRNKKLVKMIKKYYFFHEKRKGCRHIEIQVFLVLNCGRRKNEWIGNLIKSRLNGEALVQEWQCGKFRLRGETFIDFEMPRGFSNFLTALKISRFQNWKFF